ncbi:MAG TPA: hypothetical protein VK641_13480 [Terriglobales bacterium]|nr:hypothetical protein [Terriglobales bacterium]
MSTASVQNRMHGYMAFDAGVPMADCPPVRLLAARQWRAGWRAAQHKHCNSGMSADAKRVVKVSVIAVGGWSAFAFAGLGAYVWYTGMPL